MKTILLKFAGPLQSWGNDSNFNTRRTNYYPTKSAVIGLISAALGYKRDDDEHIQLLNDLKMAVRIDQQGSILKDFQMVENRQETGKNYLTSRYYLQDAIFICAIGHHDDQLINQIEEALKSPYYQPFMGRRSNPLTADFLVGSYPDETPLEVIETIEWQASSWLMKDTNKEKVQLDIYIDAESLTENNVKITKERVISFSQKERKYGPRIIKRLLVEKKNPLYRTNHDIFSAIGGR